LQDCKTTPTEHTQSDVKFSEENEIVPRYSQIEHGHKMHGATNEAFVADTGDCNNYRIVREVKDENGEKTIVVTKL
jgi:FAD/FMN-containing dehydrogenase